MRLGREEALELARRLAASGAADETEVEIQSEVDRFVRFARHGPTQSADRDRVALAVRARFGGADGWREARAQTVSLEPAALARLVERAALLARASTPDRAGVELGSAVDLPDTRACASTAAHGLAEKAEWVDRALSAAEPHGFAAGGLARTNVVARTLVNSRGRAVQGELSLASFALTLQGDEGSGFDETHSADVAELDVNGAIERVVERALAARRPQACAVGVERVVLAPSAVGALLLYAAEQGFGAQEVVDRTSFLCDHSEAPCVSTELELCDDALGAANPGWAFDGEGSPRRRVLLLSGGRAFGPVTDRRLARALGLACTGHGQAQPSRVGPLAENLVLAPGDASEAELLARVGDGLFVSHLHYVNCQDARDLLLTGVTRHGTFRIRGGRLAEPVNDLRFTDSLLRVLRGVLGVGRESARSGGMFEGHIANGALALESLRFTAATGR